MESRKILGILDGMSENWQETMTQRVADEIRRLRGDRSGQWLSGRTAELGHRVSRSTISEIETGRRKSITLADWIIIAAALDTAPVALLYPAPYVSNVGEAIRQESIPGVFGAKVAVADWFSGLGRDDLGRGWGAYYSNVRQLNVARELSRIAESSERYRSAAMHLTREEDARERKFIEEILAQHEQQIGALLSELRALMAEGDDGR